VKRGRPPKYGRPSRLIALTLPEDVLAWLTSLHADPGWAIVSLYENSHAGEPRAGRRTAPDVEIAMVGPRRGLIVVPLRAFAALPGIVPVPLSETHAFLAFEPGKGLADLEIAVLDRLDEPIGAGERRVLQQLRDRVRAWRRDPGWRFESRGILVAERVTQKKRRKGSSRP
jgi:hypothetical protein